MLNFHSLPTPNPIPKSFSCWTLHTGTWHTCGRNTCCMCVYVCVQLGKSNSQVLYHTLWIRISRMVPRSEYIPFIYIYPGLTTIGHLDTGSVELHRYERYSFFPFLEGTSLTVPAKPICPLLSSWRYWEYRRYCHCPTPSDPCPRP